MMSSAAVSSSVDAASGEGTKKRRSGKAGLVVHSSDE